MTSAIGTTKDRRGVSELIWFKACPRCEQGDVVFNDDTYGAYRQCLQCGHIVELLPASASGSGPATKATNRSGKKKSLVA